MKTHIQKLIRNNEPLPVGTTIKTTNWRMGKVGSRELTRDELLSCNRRMDSGSLLWINAWSDKHEDLA